MRYVLDSSVAFKWVVAEAGQGAALRLRDDRRAATHELLAPDVFPLEIAHALTRAERQGRVPVGDSDFLWAEVMGTQPIFHSSVPLAPRAIAISSTHRIGAYDCLYVALAEQERCEFITADDRLLRVLSAVFPFVRSLASFP